MVSEKPEEANRPDRKKKPFLSGLFQHASRRDKFLLFVGCTASVVAGAMMVRNSHYNFPNPGR